MAKLSHRTAGLSMLAGCVAIVAITAGGAQSAPGSPLYAGRWMVSDDKPVFSARGILYKTVDIAPCGGDFCGISVGPNGTCGPVLFRFLAKSVHSGDPLRGHGRWGNTRLNVQIEGYDQDKSAPDGRFLSINLGNGYDFGERSGNMPKFAAGYHSLGAAHCVAR